MPNFYLPVFGKEDWLHKLARKDLEKYFWELYEENKALQKKYSSTIEARLEALEASND